MEDSLFIVIPAYNESENIRKTVADWYQVIEARGGSGRSRLVVVDDGSTDDTEQILREMKTQYPLMSVQRKPNGGHGSAVIYGYRYALKQKADYIFQTDSDGQTDPSEFEMFWKRRERYDALFGNRTKRGDGAARAAAERVLCAVLAVIFHIRIPDANAPFRLMKADYVREYLSYFPADYNLPNVMLTALGVYAGRKVAFIPISFRPRQGGVNSVNLKKITKIGIRALRDFRVIKKRFDGGAAK